MLYADMQRWLPDHLLLRGDKTGMAGSVHARVPPPDRHLLECAWSLRALFDRVTHNPAARAELVPGESGPGG